jgi:hypothetical protein
MFYINREESLHSVRPSRSIVGVTGLHGGGRFCLTMADFADHPGWCHGAMLALHGRGFEVGASLLASPCEVWNLVGRI